MKFLIRRVVDSIFTRKIKVWSLLSTRYLWRRRGFWLRVILCWLIGVFFIFSDSEPDYDQRFKIRGSQKVDSQIVVLHLTPHDWQTIRKHMGTATGFSIGMQNLVDSDFWDFASWELILRRLLAEEPLVVGVSPYFGENIPAPDYESIRHSVFFDPRVVWSVLVNEQGRIMPSRFARAVGQNSGLNDQITDRDGTVRRFGHRSSKVPHIATQLVHRAHIVKMSEAELLNTSTQVINFRGPQKSFSTITVSELIQKKYSPDYFKNKIVIIGANDTSGVDYRTPEGEMSRAELIANVVDNIKNERWIKRISWPLASLIVLAFVVLSAFVTSTYPQFLALSIISILITCYATVSIWVFDSYYMWTPIFSVILSSGTTYIFFLSFQLTVKDYLNTQLENEREFLLQVEELKNNFLSLISHDLKTPIAKIQAICDRLISQYSNPALQSDLTALREVATELHRYIQTILQITRVESRDFRIRKEAVDINEIIESVILQLEPLARAKRILISVNLEPMFLIEADHILIREVVLNLIENAIKYTQDGGEIKISSQEVDGRVHVIVEDNGPGIPQEEQNRIFDKFYRGELGKIQPKGSGLGLYLVKYFVELHSGKVFLDSKINQGTRVGFSLPVEELESGQTIPDSKEGPYEVNA